MTNMTTQSEQVWKTRGFKAFRQGTFGNAGHNVYVSRAGVLQRIHLFDVNKDGYIDLLFCNAQDHLEAPPTYVYYDVLDQPHRLEVPLGGSCGAVADLSRNGYADLVLGMEKSGNAGMFNAYIYYGSSEGITERFHMQVPAHGTTSVTIGDFNGDGRPDLALVTQGRLRLFYQSDLGFEPKVHVDHDIAADQLDAIDLDGDGYADLYALFKDGPPRIYWGGPDGIDPDRYTEVRIGIESDVLNADDTGVVSKEERVGAVGPLARIIQLDGVPHLFVPSAKRGLLVPVDRSRNLGKPLVFDCAGMLSVAAGDINGNGHTDLVFAGRDQNEGSECSWIYWGCPDGFDTSRRTAVPSYRACDVAVGDLNGNGLGDIAICQRQNEHTYSVESLVYRGSKNGIDPKPVKLATQGARRVFIARTSDAPNPQLIFLNQTGRNARGDVDSLIYFGAATGFSPDRVAKLSGRGATSAVICDTNDNGWADVVLINSAENAMDLDPGSYLYLGGPNGLSREPNKVIPTRRGWDIATADLNRDGHLDLVIAQFYDPTILIYYGTPDGFDLEHPQRLKVAEGPEDQLGVRKVFLADLNNDGYLDLIVASAGANRCVILWGGPDGFDPNRRQVLATSKGAGDPIARDLTGNGYLDLIIGGGKASMNEPHDSFVHIFWNGPDGLCPHRHMQLPTQAAIGLTVADFNNDGYPDLFCCAYKSPIDRDIDATIYWGGPSGTYSAKHRTQIRAHSSAGCLAADFNEDGYIDLAVANHKTFGDHCGESFVLWNGPDGFDEKHPTRLPTSGPHGMLTAQPGNIQDYSSQEYYISVPFQLPKQAVVKHLGWEAHLPPKTWVKAQLRFASSRESLGQAPWQGSGGVDTWFEPNQSAEAADQTGPWLQYRLALGAVNSGNTPRVTEVNVFYE